MKKIKEEKRETVIIKTSILGIFINLLLVIFKAIVGLISNSIAIILDAVNNLSDALSSIITVISTKIADSEPDKEHPLGHGRIEYLSAMIVAGIIFYAGITSLIESIKKIFNPEEVNYSNITFIILVVSILLKLLLGKYVKKYWRKNLILLHLLHLVQMQHLMLYFHLLFWCLQFYIFLQILI